MDFAYGARDVNGDGYPEYFFTRVEEESYGFGSYLLTRPNNGGYDIIPLEIIVEAKNPHWRALSKEELAGMRKVFDRTPPE